MEGFVHKSDNLFVQLDPHDAILPPSPFPVPLVPHAAGGRLDFWGQHQFTKDVFADGQRMALRRHTAGKIPHWNIIPPWPPNVLLPIIIWFAESKCNFAAAKVLACKKPVAMALFRIVGINLACADPCSMPTSRVFTGGTVLVGFTWSDVATGVAYSAADMVLSGLANMLGEGVGKATGDFFGEMLEEGVEKALGETVEDSLEEFAEKILGENAEEIVEEFIGTGVGTTVGNQWQNSESESLGLDD